ncbi:arachidonate 5-lipoxygenase [Fusarium pseudocircinatum]|uniref:Manganese lipoxygenase n=1 Tax=Fusarium pseudocircinatum TaxID=56676 RepID=A0A8H5UXG4_9HYPO|nr:arachidonate 5-lipoxygenase [Fusarium pseudocircinatum]
MLLNIALLINVGGALSAASQPRPFSLPSSTDSGRAAAIEKTRQGFQYGTDDTLIGVNPWPAGPLGKKAVKEQFSAFIGTEKPYLKHVDQDTAHAQASLNGTLRLDSFKDYLKLYDGQWQKSVPRGLADGVLRNAKSDLYFSMERLSVHPESLRRVKPDERVALRVQDSVARKITTKTQRSLQKEGRLFIVDHSSLANLTLTKDRYAGACEALFFIHPTSGDFLPLAIRPNNGSPLVYTPLDEENDWTLAKIMLNANDVWHNQWYHLAAAHVSSDLIYMSATRSFSDMHPVWGLIRRVAVNSFAYRPGASATLVNPGGDIEKNFAWNGDQAIKYSKQEWKTECAPWQANYLEAKLKRRGLIKCNYGPELKSFPYYEDASVILGALRTFINAYVHAYYTSDAAITADKELVAWFHETAHAADIVDFPDSISTRSELVAVLSHHAYLITILHGSLNTNSLVHYSAVLPMHPLSLYKPLPKQKGISSLVPFLPDLEASIQHIALVASFNRGQIGNTTDSLHLLFEEPQFHSRINKKARAAVEVYSATLSRFSKDVKGRTLDGDGYSQGMPFVWNLYDPSTAPGILAA